MAGDIQDGQTYGRRSGEDLVLPFQVEKTGVRGRFARLGGLIDEILRSHDYPAPVSEVLGEALVVAALLGSSLKFEGSLTLQTQSDGPVSLLVASYKAPGTLRGYASLDKDRWAALEANGGAEKSAVLGEGVFALTIDPGADMHRSQGLVSLSPDGIAECTHEYFLRSEQIATRLHLAVGRNYKAGEAPDEGQWRAGGILIQHLAAAGGSVDDEEHLARLKAAREAGKIEKTEGGEDVEEAWSRVTLLLATTQDHELLDPLLPPERLLLRLFHEDGVRVFDPLPLSADCSCSQARISDVLRQYSPDDLADLAEDGRIVVRCEFCNTDYSFDPKTLAPIAGGPSVGG